MAIKSSANKYKESSKDSWKSSQATPSGSRHGVINTKVSLGSFGTDSVTKGAYNSHLPNHKNVIKDAMDQKQESAKGKQA